MLNDDLTRLPDEEPKSSLLSEGQTFGQYNVIRLLGRGGMGEVYEVEHLTLGMRHAIKLISPEIAERPNAKERFKREAVVMARLKHPNIVHVDDFGETEGHVWLRMELIIGFNDHCSLENMLEDGRLEEAEVVRLLSQVLSGLGYAHTMGVVHRDLKPANLLMDTNRNLKITDFGLVSLVGADWLQTQVQRTVAESLVNSDVTKLERDLDTESSTKALLGTYAYMSPEQKKGIDVDYRSDLYSVGLMGFQMLTGEETPGFEMPTDLVEGLDNSWDDWVKRALAARADRRFQSAAEMAQFNCGSGSGVVNSDLSGHTSNVTDRGLYRSETPKSEPLGKVSGAKCPRCGRNYGILDRLFSAVMCNKCWKLHTQSIKALKR